MVEKYLALKASAGSGKTFALSVRYISLLLMGASAKEILTLTFTNKAASEMTNRIYETLNNLGTNEDIIKAISKETGKSKEQIMALKPTILNSFINEELAIYTIDKFINKILRQFCGFVGISDDFQIEFDDEELLIYKFLSTLDEQNFENLIGFSYSENKRLGSIVELFKTLIEKHQFPEPKIYPKESLSAVIATIMEDANKIKAYVIQSALSPSAKNAVDFNSVETLLDKGKTWLLKETLAEFSYFKKDKNIIALDYCLHAVQSNIQLYFHIKESLILQKLFDLFEKFQSFRNTYNKKRNTLEFSDITNIVYKLLNSHIQKDFLYFRLDATYNHILIDEFQDTSTLQYKILSYMIEEIISGNVEKFKTFFYVGDTKQSIYRFRGGQKELFDYVYEKLSPQLKQIVLDTNYRSSQSVVGFVNQKFGSLKNYNYDFQKVQSKIQGFVQVVQTLDDFEQIAHSLKEQIDTLINQGIDYNNIAILTYTNNDVLMIYEYLKLQFPKLKFVTEMTSKLINQPNVQALINLVKYLYFKEDIYKTSFNAIMGKDLDSAVIYKVDLNDPVKKILKDLSFLCDLVNDDVIKLIENSNYETIVDFIYEIEKSDLSVTSNEQSGLQILTIFKSKGLEYDTVLVCDRITKKNSDRSSLLFEYENIELKNIFYKKSGRENFDNYYAQALLKEQNLSFNDELNILYVALTRAKNNMIIFKKQKNSVFDLLGDFPIMQTGSLYIKPKQSYAIKQPKNLAYEPIDLGFQEKSKNTTQTFEDIVASEFGIAVHYTLEMIQEFTIEALNDVIPKVYNRFFHILSQQHFNDLFARVKNLITNDQFLGLVKGKKLYKEQSLVYLQEHKIIDLLAIDQESYTIFDYKTGFEKSYNHTKQLQGYMQAVQGISCSENIMGYLVYLHEKNIEIIQV